MGLDLKSFYWQPATDVAVAEPELYLRIRVGANIKCTKNFHWTAGSKDFVVHEIKHFSLMVRRWLLYVQWYSSSTMSIIEYQLPSPSFPNFQFPWSLKMLTCLFCIEKSPRKDVETTSPPLIVMLLLWGDRRLNSLYACYMTLSVGGGGAVGLFFITCI